MPPRAVAGRSPHFPKQAGRPVRQRPQRRLGQCPFQRARSHPGTVLDEQHTLVPMSARLIFIPWPCPGAGGARRGASDSATVVAP
jgi:hypothetical protein